jgi:hypothetical protein
LGGDVLRGRVWEIALAALVVSCKTIGAGVKGKVSLYLRVVVVEYLEQNDDIFKRGRQGKKEKKLHATALLQSTYQ